MSILNSLSKAATILSPKPDECTDIPVADCPIPYREIFFNIGPINSAIFYTIAGIAAVFLTLGALRLVRIWLIGKKQFTLKQWVSNLRYVIKDGLFNRRIYRRDRYAGIMHSFVMWGVIVAFIGTVLLTIHERELFFEGGYIYGDVYLIYSAILDFFGILLIIGVLMALWRRFIVIEERYQSTLYDDIWILFALLFVSISGLFIEGARIVATGFPSFEVWSFAGYGFALLINLFNPTLETLQLIHFLGWWGHALAAQFVLAYLPFSKLSHIGAAPFNMILKEHKPFGKVSASPEPIRTIKDLTLGQLVSLDSCMQCGRCTDVCPATASGEPLSPMHVIMDTRTHAQQDYPFVDTMFKRPLQALFRMSKPVEHTTVPGGPLVTADVLWGCTSCMACVDACPVWIPHVDIITGMRGHLIDEGKQVPSTVITFLENVYRNGNEWGEPKKNRMNWAKDLEIPEIKKIEAELLWYVGCTSCYDPRNQKVARAFAKILEAAGVEYGVLGKKEICTGDAVRRVGEESLFRELAEKNITAFDKAKVKRIVTTSPHSFNVIKNEYPEFGLNPEIEVIHHTQLLYELIQAGKIEFTQELDRIITFHDPCYLGRYNDVIDPPREILKAIPGIKLKEMRRNKRQSFCCGGGGGRMFMPSHTKIKPSEIRIKEAMEIDGIQNVAVGCPWCMSMLEDARKTVGVQDQIDVLEVCELVAESMGLMD